jgi:serine/threonine-protein kinase
MGQRMNAIDTRRWKRASPYLDEVLDLPPGELGPWLDSLRAEDPSIAEDVEALLHEHQLLTAEGFLDAAPLPMPVVPMAGAVLGDYTLISPIDQGGMGSVWLAARSDGRFEGKAAIKLLNTARVGRTGDQRFRREGTILARLSHPHIGRLIDAGVSPAGQPYLVLEYIEGRHIDRFCDDRRLPIERRLRLFLDVQAAVAHAHASLIVHRDLKPSNVLVTDDGQVKLLDFGIAKLLETDPEAAWGSLLTREGESALTPKYAAPEQVTGAPITTATDVYALGVLLFELLSGQHPTGAAARSPMEFVRAVTRVEATRLSEAVADTQSEASRERAVLRGTTPEKLHRALQGDLETILAKALRTDPAARYASVAEFAEDLRRYLHDEPIAARPDTFGYRARRFMRRHRTIVSAATAAVTLIAALVSFYTWQLSHERDRARQQAVRAARVNDVMKGLLTGTDPYRNPDGTPPTVEGLLDKTATRLERELGDQPDVQVEMITAIGRTYERMDLLEKARPLLEKALAIGRRTLGPDHARIAQSLNDLGVLNRALGRLGTSEGLLRESLAMRRRVLGPNAPEVAVTLVELERTLSEQGHETEAIALAREALAIRRRVFGEEHRETATSKSDLARLLIARGELAAAVPLLRENAGTTVRVLGHEHPNTAAAKSNLANALGLMGQLDEAETLALEGMIARAHVFGTTAVEYAQSLNTLGGIYEAGNRLAEAEANYAGAVRIAERTLAAEQTRRLVWEANLARIRIARGRGAAAVDSLRHIVDVRERLYANDRWRLAQARSLLGAALMAARHYAEAEPLMRAADADLLPIAGPQGRERDANRARLAAVTAALARATPARVATARVP